MKKVTPILIFLLVVQTATAQLFTWARSGGGVYSDEAWSISAQPSGTCFVGGRFFSPCLFDTIQFSLPDTNNAFVSKYSDAGAALWVKYFPTPGNSYGTVSGVAAAIDGGCFITGSWTDSIWLDSTLLVENGISDPFFARLNENGSVMWAKRGIGRTWHDAGTAVEANQLGDVYFSGYYTDTLTIDTTTIINSGGGYSSFIAKFDSLGNLLWLNNIQGNSCFLNDMALDSKGFVLVTGGFTSNAIFDTVQITSQGNRDIFIAKYDSTGRFLWVKQYGGGTEGNGVGIDVCPNSDILITGSYTAPYATIDTITIPYLSGDDFSGFVARFDQSGNVKWVNYQSSVHGDVWNSKVHSINGNTIYFSGFYYDSLFCSNGGFREAGPASYLAACDKDGNMIWVKKIERGESIDFSLDAIERLYVSGNFRDSIFLLPYQFTGQGNSDFFFAQLGASTVNVQQTGESKELLISPNPSNGNFVVRITDGKFENTLFQLYDMLGTLVLQQQFSTILQSQKIEFNLKKELKPGLYTLVLLNREKKYVKRIVLE